ncbi:MAG: hypothetical protein KGY81_02300 [Phycisphaerae bacterium]|nr:hypothetical protein [Phycisphaerae bacterium]
MTRRNRSEPMPVKYWSAAGICLTDWCNARCASCYLACRPGRGQWMSPDMAVDVWQQLEAFSPHGCRMHLAGGEPFGDIPRLLEVIRRADRAGLMLAKVETNAFWAADDAITRDVLGQLAGTSMGELLISADPFHQQFVPLASVRRAAGVAAEILGEGRWRIRWHDWVERGLDVAALNEAARRDLFVEWFRDGRDRLNGRAADELAGALPRRPIGSFAGQDCREGLLRGKHVHILPDGGVYPGTCAGLLLGNVNEASIADLWQRLERDGASRPVLGRLVESGPVGLLDLAGDFQPEPVGYAGKCHLCWAVRRHLARRGENSDEIGPAWVYDDHESTPGSA